MIITLIFVAFVVIGLIVAIADPNSEGTVAVAATLLVVGAIALVICVPIIISTHVGVSAQIEKNKIEYESLCKRQEIAISNYEDVSRSDVIKDIAEWNQSVVHYKYLAYNPWTNWFYSKEVIDNMEMIDTTPIDTDEVAE